MSHDERRLAAIMFTDIVGYTSLTQRDEAAALELLEEHNLILRRTFQGFDGREVKTIGDSFLVEFASALNAVRCAVAIQGHMYERNLGVSAAKRVELRIGIHVGDVIMKEGDIFGDAVNVSSRLLPLAEPGGICISGQVYDHVRNKIDVQFAKMSNVGLKKVETPMDIYRVVMGGVWNGERRELDRRRVWVLPFRSMSADANDEYFAEGLTEELVSSISRVRGLSVISRTSMVGYRNKDKKAGEIGREINAGTLVEGSVRKAANRVRITVQLVGTEGDIHIWTQTYDRDLEDVFAVQSEIAEKVASSLQVQLLDEDRDRLEKRGTRSAEAYTLVLKGRFHLNRWGKDSLLTAVKYFEEAIAQDTQYAAAYVGLANAYSTLGFHDIIDSRDAHAKADGYARKALELDEYLPEAHAALAYASMGKRDLALRIRELNRALELNPNLVEARVSLATNYAFMGDWDDCLREVEKALELDPLSVETTGTAGTWYLYSGQYDKAVKYLKDAFELDSTNMFTLGNLGLAHIQQGRIDAGLEEVKRAAESGLPGAQSDLGYALVKAGQPEEAREILKKLLQSIAAGHPRSTAIAGLYVSLGEKEEALKWLERAFEEQSGYLTAVNGDFFESLRGEPRFQAILKKMGLR